MKRLIIVVLTVAILSMGLGASLVFAEDQPANFNDGPTPVVAASTIPVVDSGWSEQYTQTDNCTTGWARDDWEVTVSAFGYLTVTVRDSFIVGDYFEIWIDGALVGTTPNPGYPGGTTYSVGSATVWLEPGVHTVGIRDALDLVTYPTMCPAGYYVTGEWEPVVEFTKEITATTEAGDMDGVLETGEDWQWTLGVTLTNVSGETIHVDKVHDRLGGDIEAHAITWDGIMGSLDTYTKGKTEKRFFTGLIGYAILFIFLDNFGKTIAGQPDSEG